MTILPQMPLYVIAIICGLLSFSVTRLFMPKIIQKLEEADIVWNNIRICNRNVFWNLHA